MGSPSIDQLTLYPASLRRFLESKECSSEPNRDCLCLKTPLSSCFATGIATSARLRANWQPSLLRATGKGQCRGSWIANSGTEAATINISGDAPISLVRVCSSSAAASSLRNTFYAAWLVRLLDRATGNPSPAAADAPYSGEEATAGGDLLNEVYSGPAAS